MVDGEWWRLGGGRRGDGGGAAAGEPGESVYLPRPTVPAAPAEPTRPVAPPAPQSDPAPAVPADREPAEPSGDRPAPRSSVPRPAGRPPAPLPPVGEPAGFGGAEPGGFPGWSAHIDFSVLDDSPAEPAPESTEEPAPEPPGAEPAEAAGWTGRTGRGRKAAPAPAGPGPLAGRRPSPLLLLASVVLLGGAVTGLLLVMLVGWALAYLTRSLSDFTRKFAVLGIPLGTMTGLTLWLWGRSQGRWGAALQPGQQVGQQVWGSAPGVLRLAAVLSALFLLGVTLRRRRGE
ncbi:hypothetical protein [Kitasatospora sp. NBC_00315]|uniref:hypothetical protein n=1 Tax=Kitasatospora sp. NBC_00315 TaxID=2975963 RepID=UPI00324B973E